MAASESTTTAYINSLVGRQLRPNARMPLAAHQKVGCLLKTVLVAAAAHSGVRNAVDRIRGELDEWVMREYERDELDQVVFLGLYYAGSNQEIHSPIRREEMIPQLEEVKEILARHYPNCAPLQTLLKLADRAIASIYAWKEGNDWMGCPFPPSHMLTPPSPA